MMFIRYSALVFVSICLLEAASLDIIPRREWGARPAKKIVPLASSPMPYAIIHHSATPSCFNENACKARVKSFQDYHMDVQKWNDIGYNFVIGQDGNIYEGCGWGVRGTHAGSYNSKSIGICIVGNFTAQLPNDDTLNNLKALLSEAVDRNQTSVDYKLLGHRQVRPTDCPGQEFYELLQTWDHWSPQP